MSIRQRWRNYWERWQYEDMQEQIRYYFTVYEGIVTVIEEEQMINEEATK